MLEGFEEVSFGNSGASVSITKNGVTFNKTVLEKMNNANYVLLLVNRDARQFAIKQCTQNDANAMPFAVAIKQKATSVRWNSKELLRLFSGLMAWNLDECSGYKIVGEYLKGEKALLFDLNKAVPNS